MPGAFKLDHFHPSKPILIAFFNFFHHDTRRPNGLIAELYTPPLLVGVKALLLDFWRGLQIFWRAKGGEFLLSQCLFAPP